MENQTTHWITFRYKGGKLKKYLLTTALILSMSASGVFAADTITSPADLEKLFNENFYESPMGITMPNVEVVEGSNVKPVRGMPLFKKNSY